MSLMSVDTDTPQSLGTPWLTTNDPLAPSQHRDIDRHSNTLSHLITHAPSAHGVSLHLEAEHDQRRLTFTNSTVFHLDSGQTRFTVEVVE